MNKKKEEPEGFKCECGAWHEFSSWVYAHWSETLTHTCPKCGKKHSILEGTVYDP